MRKYSYEQINQMIQPLMDMMKADYPNNSELTITPDFAMITYSHNDMMFQRKTLSAEIKSENQWGNKMKKCNCGGDAKVKINFEDQEIENVEEANFYYACCENCGKKTSQFATREQAENAWNNL